MPIVDIEIVLKPGEAISPTWASELADELGEKFGSPPNGTWVKIHGIPAIHYAENRGKEQGVYPVFVFVLKSSLPEPDELQREVDKLIEVIAQVCERDPSFVHVIYQPEGRGRVAFGGKIVR